MWQRMDRGVPAVEIGVGAPSGALREPARIPVTRRTSYPVSRFFLAAGSISAAISVAAGAFGAHALRARVPAQDLVTFETGVRYQMYHALAMLVVAWVLTVAPDAVAARWAGRLFLVGTVIFSGSLYLLVLTDTRWLGAVTPIGGVAFLAGWACLAASAWRLAS